MITTILRKIKFKGNPSSVLDVTARYLDTEVDLPHSVTLEEKGWQKWNLEVPGEIGPKKPLFLFVKHTGENRTPISIFRIKPLDPGSKIMEFNLINGPDPGCELRVKFKIIS